jgi:hypothetical protein
MCAVAVQKYEKAFDIADDVIPRSWPKAHAISHVQAASFLRLWIHYVECDFLITLTLL